MIVHLIDGTYELFRHFYGQRRFNKGKDAPFGYAMTNTVYNTFAPRAGFASAVASGGKAISTPNVDQLAREGMRFTNAYSGSAVRVDATPPAQPGSLSWSAMATAAAFYFTIARLDPGALHRLIAVTVLLATPYVAPPRAGSTTPTPRRRPSGDRHVRPAPGQGPGRRTRPDQTERRRTRRSRSARVCRAPPALA